MDGALHESKGFLDIPDILAGGILF